MGRGSVLLKPFVMATVVGLMFVACNDEERKGPGDGSTYRSSAARIDTLETASQGTGYGGLGAGTGGAGAPDHTGVSDLDTDFVRSFYGPPGSDWRFTPGTGLYNFPEQGLGGTGPDSQTKGKPADAPKAAIQDRTKVHDLRDSAKEILRE